MDTTALRDAYRTLLETPAGPHAHPPEGGWSAEQVLAHVSLVTAETIAAAARVAAGANTTYDNRMTHDPWTLERIIVLAGDIAGLRARINGQAEALCAFGGAALSDAELDSPVPTLLLSNGKVLVDQPVPLRDLFTGLAEVEVTGHAQQLRALLAPR